MVTNSLHLYVISISANGELIAKYGPINTSSHDKYIQKEFTIYRYLARKYIEKLISCIHKATTVKRS